MRRTVSEPASIRVIVGPTAAGKTAIAMDLADEFGLAIISADSRQIYRGFDIGTAKPTREERERVPHFGIDIIDPTERYSAHRWATDVVAWSDESRTQGREPLIVGGTGFYIRALVQPLDDGPALDPERRAALDRWLESLDGNEVERWCRRLDADRASFGRTQHLRAIETALLAGTKLSAAHSPAQRAASPSGERIIGAAAMPARYLVVDPGTALAPRISARVRSMVASGWVDEVRALRTRVAPAAPAWKASGYGAIGEAVDGRCTVEAAVERVIIETRQYAKRQRTWNRHQWPGESVTVIDSTASDARERARAWWTSDDRRDL